MASRSRTRDKHHKRSGSNSPSKSRSRSRHKPRKSSRHIHKTRENKDINNNKNNNDSNNNKNKNNNELISLYEPSLKMRQELFELLRIDREEYMNKKQAAHSKISSILNSMSFKQEQRYECWNRSVIPKKIVKSMMNNVLNINRNGSNNISKKKSNIDDKSVIVMQALSKCLVMELIHKSREIQKNTINNYIQNQETKEKKKDIINNDNKMEIEIPPFTDNECNNNENKNNLIGIEVLNEMKEKKDENDNKNEKEKEDEKEIENEINEEFVLGAIRPIHIREALRKLQHDKTSFFHSKHHLFGAHQ